MQEKIARSLKNKYWQPRSFFGNFFARSLNLYLLQRRPEEWRNMQSERKRPKEQHAAPTEFAPMIETSTTSTEPALSDNKRKRKARPEDEIDALYNAKRGKGIKKAALSETASTLEDPSEAIVVKDVATRTRRTRNLNRSSLLLVSD